MKLGNELSGYLSRCGNPLQSLCAAVMINTTAAQLGGFMANVRKSLKRAGRELPQAVTAAGVAWLITVHPEAGLALAGVSNSVDRVAQDVFERMAAARATKIDLLLTEAAALAGIDLAELMHRCEQDDGLGELFVRTLRAADNTASRKKILVYAASLASVASGDDEAEWETAFVRAIDDLDPAHIVLMHALAYNTAQAGIATAENGKPVEPLVWRTDQFARIAPHMTNLPAALAALQRHGLLVVKGSPGGNVFYSGPTEAMWQLTEFGLDVLDRLELIRSVVETHPGEE